MGIEVHEIFVVRFVSNWRINWLLYILFDFIWLWLGCHKLLVVMRLEYLPVVGVSLGQRVLRHLIVNYLVEGILLLYLLGSHIETGDIVGHIWIERRLFLEVLMPWSVLLVVHPGKFVLNFTEQYLLPILGQLDRRFWGNILLLCIKLILTDMAIEPL